MAAYSPLQGRGRGGGEPPQALRPADLPRPNPSPSGEGLYEETL